MLWYWISMNHLVVDFDVGLWTILIMIIMNKEKLETQSPSQTMIVQKIFHIQEPCEWSKSTLGSNTLCISLNFRVPFLILQFNDFDKIFHPYTIWIHIFSRYFPLSFIVHFLLFIFTIFFLINTLLILLLLYFL